MALAAGLALGAAAMSGMTVGLRWRDWRDEKDGGPGPTSVPAASDEWPAPQQEEAAVGPQASSSKPSHLRGVSCLKETAAWEGFTMEEVRAHADAEHQKVLAMTPREVLATLQRGNARFWMGAAMRPEKGAFHRRALISKQFPSVAVLGCADARVPTELVFDQGLGDLFVVRVAGNCISTTTKASLQYAVHALKVKVLVVLGHELCGSLKAAMLPNEALQKEPAELAQSLLGLKEGLNLSALTHVQDQRARDREAASANVKHQLQILREDAGIMAKVEQGELLIVGAFYEISSGIVDFFHEIGPEAVTKKATREEEAAAPLPPTPSSLPPGSLASSSVVAESSPAGSPTFVPRSPQGAAWIVTKQPGPPVRLAPKYATSPVLTARPVIVQGRPVVGSPPPSYRV